MAGDLETGNVVVPSVAALLGGGFIIGWRDGSSFDPDISGTTIRVQVFDDFGNRVGDGIRVDEQARASESHPLIAVNSENEVFIVYQSSGGDASGGFYRSIGVPRLGSLDADTIVGTTVDNRIAALAGNDWVDGGLGTDVLDGGDGTDTVSYISAQAGIIVSLSSQGSYQDTIGSGLDALFGFENVVGSNFDDQIRGDDLDNQLSGGTGDDSLFGAMGADILFGGAGDDALDGGDGGDQLTGGLGNDSIDGGSNVDTALVSGNIANYTVTQTSTGVFQVIGADGTDVLTRVEFLQFDDEVMRLLPGQGVSVNFETAEPSVYQSAMNSIRDFDGNPLGGDGFWLRIGAADVNGDGDSDQILVNMAIGRFATVGIAPDGLVYFEDHSWAGETRVAGVYIDPLVESGDVAAGSDNDSQRRFQNDLQIENINRVLGADDYDDDGIWEVYFALTDGTAYLRALMHADGNIRYANYQSQQEVIDYLTSNGYNETTFGDWFQSSQGTGAVDDTLTFVNQGTKAIMIDSRSKAIERPGEIHSRYGEEFLAEFFG